MTDKFIEGKLDAVEVTSLSFLHGASTRHCLEELSLKPNDNSLSHASRKVYGVLQREQPPPDTEDIPTPIYDKQLCKRRIEQIPILLPSKMEFATKEISDIGPEPCEQLDVDSYLEHPVVEANVHLHWSQIRPISVFCDGAFNSTL